MKKTAALGVLVVVLALMASVQVLAQSGDDYAWRQQKFYVNLGFFLTSVNTTAELDSTVYGYGTSVNFENTMGLQQNPTTARLDAGWRMTNRQQLVFSWWQINRSSYHNLEQPVAWGDYTFLMGTGVRSEWNSSFYQLYYQFAFVQGAKGEFGGGIGVSYLQQKASVEGTAVLGRGGHTNIFYASRSNTLDAPVPVIGLFGTYQFTPKFFLRGDLYYLKVNVSDVDGEYTDARLVFDYYPWTNIGFGLGWYYDKYDVSSTKSDFNGSFTYDFNGPMAYVSFRF